MLKNIMYYHGSICKKGKLQSCRKASWNLLDYWHCLKMGKIQMKNQRKLGCYHNAQWLYHVHFQLSRRWWLYPKFFGKLGFNHAKLKIKFVPIWITFPHLPYFFIGFSQMLFFIQYFLFLLCFVLVLD